VGLSCDERKRVGAIMGVSEPSRGRGRRHDRMQTAE
jgi:hypothetical protein